ncbi:NAD-dependent epimerase/dehydratase family protein [Streptomyces sp. NPDC089799]|uniref:NAD-dependent epimerase/dehydratase family protein n=1 Tax=Streptomyces sp. NPDC089799 TaxID=3155066 RepID=UPI00344887A1
MRNICVIGGSRYFGRHLVELLRDAGARVTVVNRGSAPVPEGVTHVVADRDDERQLRAALGSRTFDVVIDQVLYTPAQAAVARGVFAGRTGRYVMTSTMEVYDPATFPETFPETFPQSLPAAFPAALPAAPAAGLLRTEDVLDPVGRPVPGVPAGADEATAYAEGKRQAESVLLTDPLFPTAVVRTAHVLGGGRADFTGRLAHYADRISAGLPVLAHRSAYPTSFIHHREIADFLHWTAGSPFTGPVNACSHGALDVAGLSGLVGDRAGRRPRFSYVDSGSAASPFSFDRSYAMDNARATRLGFTFGHVTDWLPQAVDEALGGAAGESLGGGHR